MPSDILSNLELDKITESSSVIVIKELKGCDSSFITSCVLGNCIKNNIAILIVTNHNGLMHYHDIGLKMNYNVKKSMDRGLLSVYDLGEEMLTCALYNKRISEQNIINNLKDKVQLLQAKHNKVNIIIDGLSHFFDMQLTLRQVNYICGEIIKIIQLHNTFLLVHCNVSASHDITDVMANILCHKAQMVVEVESLTSGLSADVSGHLTIKRPGLKYQSDNMYIMKQKPSQYLFKLFDRGVKLLAPGTV